MGACLGASRIRHPAQTIMSALQLTVIVRSGSGNDDPLPFVDVRCSSLLRTFALLPGSANSSPSFNSSRRYVDALPPKREKNASVTGNFEARARQIRRVQARLVPPLSLRPLVGSSWASLYNRGGLRTCRRSRRNGLENGK
jgi:hypothetical protein